MKYKVSGYAFIGEEHIPAQLKNGIIPFFKYESVTFLTMLWPLLFVIVGAFTSIALECLYFTLLKKYNPDVYVNLGDTLMISNISEWQPTVLSKSSHYAYFIVIIVIGSIFLLSKKKIKFLDLVLFGVSVFLGLKSIRFWPYTYIIMSFIVFDYIPERKDDKGTNMIMLVLGCLFLLPFIFSYEDIYARMNSFNLNEKMISTIKKESPKRLYNMYDYGGELIYDDIDVFIDGRADLYSKYNLKNLSRNILRKVMTSSAGTAQFPQQCPLAT